MTSKILSLGIGLVFLNVNTVSAQSALKLERVKAFRSDCLVCSAAFNPSGTLLAYVNDKGWLVICDLEHDRQYLTQQVADPKDHWNYRFKLAFSPDGRMLATHDAVGTITLWEVASGKRRISFRAPTTTILALFFSKDGTNLVSAGKGAGTITVWGLNGKPRFVIEADKKFISAAVLSPDGKSVLAGGSEGIIKSWRLVDGKVEALAIRQPSSLEGLAATTSNILVTAYSAYSGLDLWSPKRDRLATVGSEFWPRVLASSPNDDVVAIGGDKNMEGIVLLSVSKPNNVQLTKHDSEIIHLAFSADGKRVVSCDADGCVIIWNRKNKGVGSECRVIASKRQYILARRVDFDKGHANDSP